MPANTELSGNSKVLLALSAVVMLALRAAVSCPSLALSPGEEMILGQAAQALGLLCLAILLQDLIDPYVRRYTREARTWFEGLVSSLVVGR